MVRVRKGDVLREAGCDLRFEDGTLLALKGEEGLYTKECQKPLEARKGGKQISLWNFQKKCSQADIAVLTYPGFLTSGTAENKLVLL